MRQFLLENRYDSWQGKKKALSQFLLKSRLDRAIRAFCPPSLTVFNYHRLRENAQTYSPFDDGVFGVTKEEFRSQLKWLSLNSTVLSEQDLLVHLREKRPLPSRSTMITFDDGYSDNYSVALPILEELRVPALFFIPTAIIENRCVGDWDIIAYLIKHTKLGEIKLYGKTIRIKENIQASITMLQRHLQLSGECENARFLNDLSVACDVALPSSELTGSEFMTWSQVADAAARGVAIGSHTHSHLPLAPLDAEVQKQQLLQSKQILQEKLGRPIHTLAYPFGGYESFNSTTKQLAKECGYEAAFSYHTGINGTENIDPFDIRRVAAPDETAVFAGIFAMPSIFGKPKCENRALA